MLANEFGAEGFALDLSADALRHGIALMDRWGLSRAPVRMAGDALHLPFRDGCLRFVIACQTLSQFMDIESRVPGSEAGPGARRRVLSSPRNPCGGCFRCASTAATTRSA